MTPLDAKHAELRQAERDVDHFEARLDVNPADLAAQRGLGWALAWRERVRTFLAAIGARP